MTTTKSTSLPLFGATALLAFFASHCSSDSGGSSGTGGQTSASGGSSAANGGSSAASGGSSAANGGSTAASGGSTAANGGSTAASGGASSTLTDVNGCTPAMAEDHSAASDARKVQVGVNGLTFTPACMAIKAGQSVSFEGQLSGHPLAPGNADHADAGSPNNPIMKTSTGMSVSFTFATPGAYPYYCQFHSYGAGQGMAGVIYVMP